MTSSTRDRLVDTAMQLFWAKGYASTRVADVLLVAGVNFRRSAPRPSSHGPRLLARLALREDARDLVDRAACRKYGNQLDGFRRPRLRDDVRDEARGEHEREGDEAGSACSHGCRGRDAVDASVD